MSYKVTIIMSNYNQEKYISQAIESVLNQKTNFPFQLIITDDFSTKDNSVKIIKEYEKKYPNIIKALYNKENGKYLKNILRAKAITKTPYFCLLDSDDYWIDENYLQCAVDFLDSHSDYVIYSRNVICKTEKNEEYLFVPQNIPISSFTIDNYISGNISITQTTGSFFRNVIFINDIPEIMKNAVGTISERSFEGDFDRYIMHLKYGKAYYNPKPCGVYRILSSGIWSRLSNFEKNIIQAQCYIDYNEYFENTYKDFFIKKAYIDLKNAFNTALNDDKLNNIEEIYKEMFFNVLIKCSQEREIILSENIQQRKIKFKYKILLKLYKYCKKKLLKKGYIDD